MILLLGLDGRLAPVEKAGSKSAEKDWRRAVCIRVSLPDGSFAAHVAEKTIIFLCGGVFAVNPLDLFGFYSTI